MYQTPDRLQAYHEHYATPPQGLKTNLAAPYAVTPPKYSPLRSGDTSSSHRHTASQPIIAPATPAHGIYVYPDGSPMESPRTSTAHHQQTNPHSGQQLDVDYRRTPSRSPQSSRSPSPGPAPQSRGMPANAHSQSPSQPRAQIYETPTRHAPTHSSNAYNPSTPDRHGGRPAGLAPSSGATPTSHSSARSMYRHVRMGLDNRRGDHLTADGYIV